MAMLMKVAAAIVLATAMMMVAAAPPSTEAAITCGTVVQTLFPCVGWVQGGGLGGVPGTCCNGVKGLYRAAATTPDRQAVCKCLVSLAGSYPGFTTVAAGLPGKCGVTIPYKISPSIDCNKIK